jgi:ATP-binding cassette subfamily B protein
VQAGEVVLVCGASGSGKSTLARLLLGLYQPTAGTVRLDGVPLRDLDPAWVRDQIGVVEQDATLWSASVRDNIRYAASLASANKISCLGWRARAHE